MTRSSLWRSSEDITERKRAQQALAESEERLRTIVELAPDGIFVVGEQGQIIEVNQAACKQLRYTREQLLRLSDFRHHRPALCERAAARLKGKLPAGTYESAQIRADGVEIPVELSVSKIVFRRQPAFIRITRDISDRKRAEEQRGVLEQQLRQAQKMEAVGQLAGGIAHDFNNLLMVIQSYTEMLQDSLAADDRLRRNTREILKAAERAAGLTRQMLAFSRKQILSPTVLDLNAVVEEAAKMLKRLIGADIEFRVIAASSPWAIEADSGSDRPGFDESVRECQRCNAARRHAHNYHEQYRSGRRAAWRSMLTSRLGSTSCLRSPIPARASAKTCRRDL